MFRESQTRIWRTQSIMGAQLASHFKAAKCHLVLLYSPLEKVAGLSSLAYECRKSVGCRNSRMYNDSATPTTTCKNRKKRLVVLPGDKNQLSKIN